MYQVSGNNWFNLISTTKNIIENNKILLRKYYRFSPLLIKQQEHNIVKLHDLKLYDSYKITICP